MILLPRDVRAYGLQFLNARDARWSESTKTTAFHRFYGSSPTDVTDIWCDLVAGEHLPKELRLTLKEKNEKGFKKYMMAHFWLWAYPKNSTIFATIFGDAERTCRGAPLWVWIKRIAALKTKKILWENVSADHHLEIFSISDDGTDFKLNKWAHPTMPRDNSACLHKMKHAAAKYKVVMSGQRAKCVHIAGPFKGGTHDLEMFRQGGLKEKLKALNVQTIHGVQRIKLCLANRDYNSKDKDEQGLFSLPNSYDTKELNRFKSHGRLRHKTFNGRLKFFFALSQTFHHGFNKHKFVFEAIVVIVQYQMDNGSPIFLV